MKRKIPKVISLLIVSIVMMIFVGCGTIETSTDVKINKDGSSNTIFRIAYDETIKNIMNDGILKQVFGDEANINIYSENNNTVEEVSIDTPKIDIKELIKSNALNMSNLSYDTSELIKYDVNREKGFLKDKYTVTIQLTKNIMEEINYNIENEVNTNINNYLTEDIRKYLSGNITGFLSGNITTYVENYVSEIPYDLTISIPFAITDSNATSKVDSYTGKWNYTLQDLNPDTEISLSFLAPNIVNIALIAVGVIILIIVILIVAIKSRRRK